MIGRLVEEHLNFIYAPSDAVMDIHPRFEATQIEPQLIADRVLRLTPFVALMSGLDQLLGPKCDQYADDNDTDFPNEGAPPVKRFGKVEMHAAGPPASAG